MEGEEFLAEMAVMEYAGEQVQGAEFVVYQLDDGGEPQFWNEDQAALGTLDDATRYVSDDEGQVLIEGLPEGEYFVREVNMLPGFTAFDGPDYGFDNSGWDSIWQPFVVKAGVSLSKHSPVINYPASFHGIFIKYDGADLADNPRPLKGATFRVYREKEGVKEYLNYHKMPLLSRTILPAFFPDEAQAFVFASGRVMEGYMAGYILIPGLPTYWPGTDQPVTYYLEELTGIPGYAPLTAPLAFTAQDFDQAEIGENDYLVANTPIDRTITIFKTGDPRALNSGMGRNAGWAQALAGAAFILLKPDSGQADAYWVLTGDGTAFSTETVVIENLQGRRGDEIWEVVKDLSPYEVETAAGTGAAAFTDLEDGEYYVVETRTPPGHVFAENLAEYPVVQQVIIENGQHQAVDFVNLAQEGSIIFQKVDAFTGQPLPGVKFILKVKKYDPNWSEGYLGSVPAQGEAPSMVEKHKAHVFTSDENGMVYIPNLITEDNVDGKTVEYRYHLMEIETLEGYYPLLEREIEVWSLPAYVEYPNIPLGKIPFSLRALKKLKYGTLQDGQFTFGIYQREPDKPDQLLGITTNDADGVILFKNVWIDARISGVTQLVVKEVVPPEEEWGNIIYDAQKECVQEAEFWLPPPEKMYRAGGVMPMQNGETTLSAAAIALMFKGGLIFVLCGFENEVKLAPVDVEFEADKSLYYAGTEAEEAPLDEGAYRFTLTKLDPASPGDLSVTAANDAQGKVVFPAISFD